MKALVQRVTEGSVSIDGEVVGSIGKGLVILFGAGKGDTEKDAKYLAEKCVNLRIFNDEEGRMNRSLLDIEGEVLIISQFTLYGDCRKGRRPGFSDAALPEEAEKLYELFKSLIREQNVKKVACGRFGADMKVKIFNDGPVTFMLEAENGVGI
ncbi:MAG: D-tyrosyl-tRNA(Tyr) deacylase [Lentisphaeria bacterium]|nr:D-tyrosyl-tRNA(Tyr) deacylase [Lentisphaeria bacterium]